MNDIHLMSFYSVMLCMEYNTVKVPVAKYSDCVEVAHRMTGTTYQYTMLMNIH